MSRVAFLVEDYSMKVFLESFVPKHFPDMAFICISHEGKNDLQRSIPKKLRAWHEDGLRFVILQDNDGGNCADLKNKLKRICFDSGRNNVLIRIACQELEAWYLGDPEALATAFNKPKLINIFRQSKYRDPDKILKPSIELKKLLPEFQKVSGARIIAPYISVNRNNSKSLSTFVSALVRITEEMTAEKLPTPNINPPPAPPPRRRGGP